MNCKGCHAIDEGSHCKLRHAIKRTRIIEGGTVFQEVTTNEDCLKPLTDAAFIAAIDAMTAEDAEI